MQHDKTVVDDVPSGVLAHVVPPQPALNPVQFLVTLMVIERCGRRAPGWDRVTIGDDCKRLKVGG
jgi:hypothetical protein